MGNAGESADEHAKRLINEAGAWAAGAEGERRVAAALETLPVGWTVVHDRLLRPGRSEANLDHIVIGPTGVYLVDAKNRAGRVAEHNGGLFQHKHHEGRSESVSLAGELKKVHGMAAYMAAESDRPVTPVLCLAGARAEEFGEPRMIRGVWVVPVAALPGWLRARPRVLASEDVPTVATRVITDFPSTTTDPSLLAAMAGASVAARSTGRGRGSRASRQRTAASPSTDMRRPKARGQRRVARALVRLAVGGVMIAVFLALLANLPTLLTSLVEALANGPAASAGTAPVVPADAVITTKSSAGKPTSSKGASSKAAAAKPAATPKASKPIAKARTVAPIGPPDCANASAAEVGAIIGRTVKPVYTSRGCLWGTRLDDGSTALVSIALQSRHDSWDSVMEGSVKQKRAIFGTDYSSVRGAGTRVSIAAGQPITRAVRARADTVVVVATNSLGVSDDRARQMALAIAVKANG